MKRPRFDIYESKDGWRWRLIAANGRILASGEEHTRKADAERSVLAMALAVRDTGVAQMSGQRAI